MILIFTSLNQSLKKRSKDPIRERFDGRFFSDEDPQQFLLGLGSQGWRRCDKHFKDARQWIFQVPVIEYTDTIWYNVNPSWYFQLYQSAGISLSRISGNPLAYKLHLSNQYPVPLFATLGARTHLLSAPTADVGLMAICWRLRRNIVECCWRRGSARFL